MDLVDEQDVAGLEVGQERGEVAGPRDHRTRGGAEADIEFARDDLGERGLAESGRTDEQHVIERLGPRFGGVDEDAQVLAYPVLADELVEPRRPEAGLGGVAGLDLGRHHPVLAHRPSSLRLPRISASTSTSEPRVRAALATAEKASTRR